MLEVSRLLVKYGENIVLNVDRTLFRSGEATAIIGPNGAGKTTFLKCLAGLLKPQAGVIRLNGREITGKIDPQIGVVLQRPVLFSGTVTDNIVYGLRCRGIPSRRAREMALEALHTWGMADFADKRKNMLSGGEQQRIALIRTLILDPEVLLLDEPFTFLDREASEMLVKVINQVCHEKRRILVFATHDLQKGCALADTMIRLVHGGLSEHRAVNMFRGISICQDERCILNVSSTLSIQHTTKVEGPVTVYIDPASITLSRHRQTSTARNNFHGSIVSMRKKDGLVRIVVDAGERFHVDVTPQSCRDLDLTLETPVWISFKASAVQCLHLYNGLSS